MAFSNLDEVVPGLFLGSAKAAGDYRLLKTKEVTHILNCAVEVPCYFSLVIQI